MISVDTLKLQKALKHLSKAAVSVKKKEVSKVDLDKRMQSIKTSFKKGKPVLDDIEELEQLLRQVLKNERDMLEQQRRYADLLKKKLEELSPDVKHDLDDIKKLLDRNMSFENLHASEYRDTLKRLEFNLGEAEKDESENLNLIKQEVETSGRKLSEIRDGFLADTHERSKRIEELEKRIRQDVQGNRKQLLLIEQEIRHLERKSRELKKEGAIDKVVLSKVDDKISMLKQKSEEIKKKYPPSTDFVPKQLSMKKPVPPSIIKTESMFKPKSDVNIQNVSNQNKIQDKPVFRVPSLSKIKEDIKIEKHSEGISELTIPSKPSKGVTPSLPPKPISGLSSVKSMDSKPIPIKNSEFESVESNTGGNLENPLDLENEMLKQELKSDSFLPNLEPQLDKKFEMPNEFPMPKKLTFWDKVKDWLGI